MQKKRKKKSYNNMQQLAREKKIDEKDNRHCVSERQTETNASN